TTHLYITSYDKAELREAVSAAELEGYNNKYYADKQYEAYENALKNAKEVLGKAETNQNEVDEATRQLEAAIENLVKAENEARFVLTVTHSIHDGADRNSENPDVSNKDYYLIATNESVEAALLSAEVLEGYTVNKHDAITFFAIEDGKDTEKEYHYWYIDYSDVQDAIAAADEIIKNKDDYSPEFIEKVEKAKEDLEAILNNTETDTPESQSDVDTAVEAATELTGHTHNEGVIIPAQAPSCTFDGLTEGAKCSECGMITKAQTTVNASGHNFRTIAAKAATCLAPGNVEYKQCTVCNLFFAADAEVTSENGVGSTASFVLKQLDHSYTGEYQWNNAGETKYHSQQCVNGCGEYGPEEACDFESVETSAPTCTVGGTITHTCKVCNNSYNTYTSANGHSWSDWELETAPTAETDGTYIRTCQVCNTTEEKSVKREDYSAYDEAVKRAEDLLKDEKLTPEAKEVIQNALDEANKLDQKLPADVVEDGKTIIDNANDEKINAAADALNNALDSLYDENGKLKSEYEKVDYTNYDNAVDAYETIKDTMTAEDKAAVEAIKAEIAEIPADGSKKDYQEQVDKAATDIAAINAKYGNCATGNHTWGEPVLTTAPTATEQGEYTETCEICGATQITKVDLANYDEFDKAVEKLETLLDTENLTDEAKQAIEDALADAKELDKNLPADVTTVDGKEIKGGQDEIDALVAELNGIVVEVNGAIADGSALKPDYSAWESAEGAYDALDKTNVKADIIAEANALKQQIADKQDDETLTQATATQTDINNATTRLNQIIEGINDGSLKDPDYSAVEDKIDEAKDNDNLNKDTQDKIEEIEKALEEIKGRTEPEANYRDNQDEVNALEDQLD
ncbi:MAG: hypothetical protein IJB93_02995, partial [Clostridia bacterium]|nr:hypothetical protein [Clostridia bacterium]